MMMITTTTIDVLAHPVERLGYGRDERGSIPGRGNNGTFSLRHSLQTGSGAHPAPCLMGIVGKAAGA